MTPTQPKLDTAGQSWIGPEGVIQTIATADTLDAPGLKALFAYWTARRGSRFAPTRAEIEPRGMVALLPWIHLYDAIDGGQRFLVRLAGASITENAGAQFVGSVFDETCPELVIRRAVSAMHRVVEMKLPIRSYAARFASEKPSFKAAENLWLPLSDDGASVDKILACSVLTVANELR